MTQNKKTEFYENSMKRTENHKLVYWKIIFYSAIRSSIISEYKQ